MQIGDRVLYVSNLEIDFTRDLGTLVDYEKDGWPIVTFDDGFSGPIPEEDLMRVKTHREVSAEHGYFGCLQNPCPQHNSNRE